MSENAAGEIFQGVTGTVRFNGVEHGVTLGIRVRNRSISLVNQR